MKIGILGNGQLARMLALAGKPLGLDFAFYSPRADGCADALGAVYRGELTDTAALSAFAAGVDAITVENENIPATTLRALPADKLMPAAAAVVAAQDRLAEKRFFQSLGFKVAAYQAVESEADLRHAFARAQAKNRGVILKTRRDGYDGRGQVRVHSAADIAAAYHRLQGRALIAEEVIPFERELSIIAIRAKDGAIRYYPLSENEHHHGILRVAAARRDDPLQRAAQQHAHEILAALDYVGALGLECFVCGGELLANEFAPRVHNTGHWSLDGAASSQFENHLRAICGMPLGDTHAMCDCVMFNIIGAWPDKAALLRLPGTHVHDYQKAARPGRKIGHVTLCGAHGRDMQAARAELGRLIKGA